MHGAVNWSDPRGSTVIRVADEEALQKYRFALRTADFYVCRICGGYPAAVLADEEGTWSTVNLRLAGLEVPSGPASYGSEETGARVERRKRVWTPTTVIGAA